MIMTTSRVTNHLDSFTKHPPSSLEKAWNPQRSGTMIPTTRHEPKRKMIARFGSVPCRVRGDFAELLSQVTISNTPFQFIVIVSMEGEAYYSKNVKIKPSAYQGHKYYATTSFRSEIPLPYYSKAEYPSNLQTAPAVK
jgi:hypothetical protein